MQINQHLKDNQSIELQNIQAAIQCLLHKAFL